MSISFRPWLIRAHRWIGVALAPVFLAIILSGAVLSFRPLVADLTPATTTSVNVQALAATLGRLEAKGPVDSISLSGGAVAVTSRSTGPSGAFSVATGAPAAVAVSSANVFDIAERIHKSLFVGLGFIVQAATWAMLAAVVAGPLLAAFRFRNTIMGWHRFAGWALFPLVVALPLTGALMTLGLGHSGAALPISTHPITISQALGVAAPSVDLSDIKDAHMFRGGSVMIDTAKSKYIVTDKGATALASGPSLIQQIHEGTWAGAWSGALNFVGAMALFGLTISGVWSWARRARREKRTANGNRGEILVAHASQSGTATRFAETTARALETAGQSVEWAALGALKPEDLRGRRAVLIVAATTGQGEMTDGAQRFVKRLAPSSLRDVPFALLALGDRDYANFCGGGESLREALLTAGAREAAPLARADGEPTAAWTAWLQELGASLRLRFGGAAPVAVASTRFRLVGRSRLDEPAYADTQETWSLALEAESDLDFRPGDVLRIAPELGGRERSYSIGSSSLVDARLVVLTLSLHRFIDATGSVGYGRVSGELIREAPLGGLVLGRVQAQSEFRPPEDPTRPIVMIAAGSGVAPFPGFLDEREASGWAGPAWLIFGNRHRDGDFLWGERFTAALRDGSQTRLDVAFSRDADDGDYVQDRLREHAAELRRWLIEDHALVYICGRREMAREVEAAIAAMLAESAAPMIDEDRIRIDAFD